MQTNKKLPVYGVVLAAGKGSRMQSNIPKVLHPLAQQALILHVLDAAQEAGLHHLTVVVGHGRDQVESEVNAWSEAKDLTVAFAHQKEQLGTGHAVMVCEPYVPNKPGYVVVLLGDVPLLQGYTLRESLDYLESSQAEGLVITMHQDDPTGYGRILRDENGHVVGIREEKDATEAEKGIKEANTGIFIFTRDSLFWGLRHIDTDNAQGEYYLTDLVSVFRDNGKRLVAWQSEDTLQFQGVNSVEQLQDLEARSKILRENQQKAGRQDERG